MPLATIKVLGTVVGVLGAGLSLASGALASLLMKETVKDEIKKQMEKMNK